MQKDRTAIDIISEKHCLPYFWHHTKICATTEYDATRVPLYQHCTVFSSSSPTKSSALNVRNRTDQLAAVALPASLHSRPPAGSSGFCGSWTSPTDRPSFQLRIFTVCKRQGSDWPIRPAAAIGSCELGLFAPPFMTFVSLLEGWDHQGFFSRPPRHHNLNLKHETKFVLTISAFLNLFGNHLESAHL